jgi:hypothetical protein
MTTELLLIALFLLAAGRMLRLGRESARAPATAPPRHPRDRP